jgi:hypothetical protein
MLGKLMGVALGNAETRRGNKVERGMMQQQYQNQRNLNQQGHELQMDMWNKTNYGAQLQHMKDAGLNPGLMYGMGGGGGTTAGSQGGGSAAKGSAQKQMGIEGLMAAAQTELINAQKRNVDADTQNKKDENPNIEKQGFNIDANTQNLMANNAKAIEEIKNLVIQNKKDFETAMSDIAGITAENAIKVIDAEIADKTKKDKIIVVVKEIEKITSETNKNNAQENLAKIEGRVRKVEAEMAEDDKTFKGDDIRFRTVKEFLGNFGKGVKKLIEDVGKGMENSKRRY